MLHAFLPENGYLKNSGGGGGLQPPAPASYAYGWNEWSKDRERFREGEKQMKGMTERDDREKQMGRDGMRERKRGGERERDQGKD